MNSRIDRSSTVMQEENVLYLSPEAFAHFKAVLDDPSPPHPNLIKAAMKTIQTTTVLSFDREMLKEMCALIMLDCKGFETAFNEVIPKDHTLSQELIKAFNYAEDEDCGSGDNLIDFISYMQEHKLIDEEETVSVYSCQLTKEEAAAVRDAAINLVGSAKAYINNETDFFPWKENVISALALTKTFPKELSGHKYLANLINETLLQMEDDE